MNMNDLQIFHSIKDFRTFRAGLDFKLRVGLVPTMGALHAGHGALLKKSVSENDITVLSIFINPTQFNNPEDLKKYPRTWEADLKLAKEAGVQVVISPEFNEIYSDNYRFKISETDFSTKLCGAYRPGHFDGVLTVVMKLLQIANANKAYFGEKDFQQLQLIQEMARTFFLRTEIIGCPTVREANGLAMSSRNTRLSPAAREVASVIHKVLTEIENFENAKALLAEKNIELEYLEEHYGRRFIAAYLEGVRLIDNVCI